MPISRMCNVYSSPYHVLKIVLVLIAVVQSLQTPYTVSIISVSRIRPDDAHSHVPTPPGKRIWKTLIGQKSL